MFDIHHARTHSVMLPHVTAYNAAAATDALQQAGRALGAATAWAGLLALNRSLPVPVLLRELGMLEDGVELAIRQPDAKPAQLVPEFRQPPWAERDPGRWTM